MENSVLPHLFESMYHPMGIFLCLLFGKVSIMK